MCLCRKECVLQIGIDRGEVVLEISKELLIKDLKEFNSIDKLFLFSHQHKAMRNIVKKQNNAIKN